MGLKMDEEFSNVKPKPRRHSIFSLLKKQIKVHKNPAELSHNGVNLGRKFSVDSAILSDYKANGFPNFSNLEKTLSCDAFNDNGEMASAASDTESEDGVKGSQELVPKRRHDVIAHLREIYVEDMNVDVGTAGELVEEVAEENKSLLWFLLKQVRPGMDLSKVVLPTFILEPRSFLDKLSDYYYHADLLAEASKLDDPYVRFIGVLRWYLSGMYRKPKGLKKPYNPVLGEAFRCCWRRPRDTNSEATYYVAEQVSHHPPVSAFYVSNRKDGYTIEGSLLARSKFYGNSTSAILEGCARVRLLNRGEVYISTAPYAHCKGLLIGTLSMELGGKVTIMCQQTGYTADVEFKLRSFLGGADQTNHISGKIRRGKDTVATLEGYWDHRIDIKDKRTGEDSILLDVGTLKERRLPRYLVKMDQQMEHESANLWRHVSEAILNDDQVAATEQKTIIEERQRAKARTQDSEWRPLYFTKETNPTAPEGIVDQGFRYKYANHSPWMNEEILEYEEDFIIKSLQSGASSHGSRRPAELNPGHLSDSESDPRDNTRRKHANTTRSLKNTLSSIDSSLKEQSIALERLSQKVDSLSLLSQKSSAGAVAEQGRVPPVSFFWDLLCGVILAMICQALFNWLFYYKD